MKRELLTFYSLLILYAASGFSTVESHDKENHDKENKVYEINQKRSFSHLDGKLDVFAEANSTTAEYFTEDFYEQPTSAEEQLRAQIDATFEKVKAENRFVKFLDEGALLELPVGIKSDIGALSYVILIDSVIATPQSTLLYASMQFEGPKIGKIHFRGADIAFSKEGGITGGKLELVGDYEITDEGAKTQFFINGNSRKTYVEFDCSGFQQFSIDASLLFSNTLVKPEDDKGKLIEGKNVKVDFTTTLTDWNDLLLNVNIPRFQVNKLPGVSFEVKNAVLDWSDTRNMLGVNFPEEYSTTSPYFIAGTPNLWRGVFINSLEVKLPAKFDKGDTNRVSFSGTNLLIDNQGFSGLLAAEDLIPLNKGKLGKWHYSLDDIHIELVANAIKEAGFSGKIDIPVNSKENGATSDGRLFAYSAMIQPGGDYQFVVSNPDTLEFDLWKANVTLLPSSYVEVATVEGKFRPKANLSGTMDINIGLNSEDGRAEGDNSKNAKLAQITFQNLEIQSVKPYVKVGQFSLGTSSNSLGGFPISITRIGGGQSNDKVYLDVSVTLSLTGSEGGSFGAGGDFRIIAKDDAQTDEIKYRFHKLQINGFSIDIDNGDAFQLSGTLNFYKGDNVYGNGISGTVDATFAGEINLQASAIFGSLNGMRYWYADALVDLGPGIPVFTGVYLNRFGGGISYHMAMDSKGIGSKLGKTVSGVVYVPDKNVGLGLKAMVGLKGDDEKMFNADATFEMAFRTGGGLKYINFRGNVYLMTTPEEVNNEMLSQLTKKMADEAKSKGEINNDASSANSILGNPDTKGAAIYGGININYDFDNKTLHANLVVVINVGGGVITGGGNAVMHFSPSEWYVYIGRPEYENRFGLEIAGIARTSSYFVMGSVVPDTPPPPSTVSSIMGDIDLDYMSDLNALADGAGIGFGASFDVDTGDQEFMIFYGRFQVGAGFDVMLRDYGNTTCVGSGQLGVNGWYANGQAYAYFDGKIGVKVKLFRKTKRVSILEIGAAVVLQAKLPNPLWMKGNVGGYFKVLGGLVKGNCSFDVEIGEECVIENRNSTSALAGIDVIAQVTPQDGVSDVDVFSLPQAVFNYELERAYYTTGYDDEEITFKIALDLFRISSPNGVVDAEIEWNEDQTVAVLKPTEILPPHTELTVEVVTSFQELKNNVWETTMSDGEELKESKSITFTTGEAPDYIPESNVAYSYPTKNMLNLYRDEYGQGYMKLNQGQSYLFEAAGYSQVVRFSSSSGIYEGTLNYNKNNQEITYSIPSELATDAIYQLIFVSVPQVQTDLEANVSTTESEQEGTGLDVRITTRSAIGTVTNYEEQELHASSFRTSKYLTFDDKVKSVNPSSGWRASILTGVHVIGSNISGPEPFSKAEMFGTNDIGPLVTFEADLTDNDWYESAIYPLIHEHYPLPGNISIPSTVRDVNVLGIVPKKAIQLVQYPYNFQLEESDIASGAKSFGSSGGFFEYQLAYYMYYDYVSLKNQAANYLYSQSSNNSVLTRLAESTFPTIEQGDYYMDIHYVLPGRNSITSTHRHKIYNPIE